MPGVGRKQRPLPFLILRPTYHASALSLPATRPGTSTAWIGHIDQLRAIRKTVRSRSKRLPENLIHKRPDSFARVCALFDQRSDIAVMARIYYGWWIVSACLLAAMIGNALGLFGAGVYLRAITTSTGWATGAMSGAVTLFYVVSAVLLIPVGSGIRPHRHLQLGSWNATFLLVAIWIPENQSFCASGGDGLGLGGHGPRLGRTRGGNGDNGRSGNGPPPSVSSTYYLS
jgi:hypothetical protein